MVEVRGLVLEYRRFRVGEARMTFCAVLKCFVVCPAENVQKERRNKLIYGLSGLHNFLLSMTLFVIVKNVPHCRVGDRWQEHVRLAAVRLYALGIPTTGVPSLGSYSRYVHGTSTAHYVSYTQRQKVRQVERL